MKVLNRRSRQAIPLPYTSRQGRATVGHAKRPDRGAGKRDWSRVGPVVGGSCQLFEHRQDMIDVHMVETKFLPATHRHSITVDSNANALINKLRGYTRVDVPKWL